MMGNLNDANPVWTRTRETHIHTHSKIRLYKVLLKGIVAWKIQILSFTHLHAQTFITDFFLQKWVSASLSHCKTNDAEYEYWVDTCLYDVYQCL